ncbi:MFS transporter [Vagococcus vulneris]|uniref:Tetracycline resistance MFS efflux pump n=1 Tax=Vagococcus vulneris TaxID=1977869 RepID=A0A430A1A4_9ENTE|nr:MFS transporter [Vagococcus vulneris]RSU00163.1 tetracycline resistance MFS efflux pump [Vagococcus vulneris]
MTNKFEKHTKIFGFISVFLTGIGLTIISPILPFLINPYVHSAHEQATMITLMMSVYSGAVFIFAPILGNLSDRIGRRPILLFSLAGSAVGYIILGINGSLIMIFIGRLIEGITGGEISTLFAYFSDITNSEERTRYFGWMSATVGVGTAAGPVVGGLLSHFGTSVPLFAGAAVTLVNACYGYFFMPETLKKKRIVNKGSVRNSLLKSLNPVHSLRPQLKNILISGSFVWLSAGLFQSLFGQLTIDTFRWQAALIGVMYSIIGIMDIVSQVLFMPYLLKYLSDQKIAAVGLISELISYGVICISVITGKPIVFVIGMIIFGFGDSLFGPSFNGLLSKQGTEDEQGKLQGQAQSLQALSRVVGPLIGGQLYGGISHITPILLNSVLLLMGLFFLSRLKDKSKLKLGKQCVSDLF